MLVVVHDGDVEGFLQPFLYIEAFRSLYVLEIDASECRGDFLYGFTEFLWVFLVYLNIKDVNTSIDFEKQSLSFHDGFS